MRPSRGEIWVADLDPTRGHEQAGRRPVLVVSTNLFNYGPAGLIFVVPITRTERGIPFHIRFDPPEGGIQATSFILCDALRSISRDRLIGRPWGKVTPNTLLAVEEVLRLLMEL